MKQPHFLHDNINSQKLKTENFWLGMDKKWLWPSWCLDSKIDCI